MEENELLTTALLFATEKHRKQTRKDGSAYIYHPFRVAEYVRGNGYGIPFQITAILHDTLEDTDATEEEIRIFGEDVLEAVKLLTRPKGADEEAYVRAILDNNMAAVVKNADKIDNIADIVLLDGVGNKRTERNIQRARKYIEKSKKYYYGYFSEALDYVIDSAEKHLTDYIVRPRIDVYGQNSRLYTKHNSKSGK